MSIRPTIGDVKFDHLTEVVSTRFLHCKGIFNLYSVGLYMKTE